jgi:ribosomal protein S18 acetylase RimI-like enzyme
MNNSITTSFIKLSETEPEAVRKLMINEVGEKAKEKLYNNLKDLADSYPNFEDWFYNIVMPQMEVKNGKREIIIAISEVENREKYLLTGIAILKNTVEEKKICTFRVHKDFRNQGIGTGLFEECFKYLGTRKPKITISENTIEMFKKHIEYYEFDKCETLEGYYKNGIKEYVYNGKL